MLVLGMFDRGVCIIAAVAEGEAVVIDAAAAATSCYTTSVPHAGSAGCDATASTITSVLLLMQCYGPALQQLETS
jgi:hypothetical protein